MQRPKYQVQKEVLDFSSKIERVIETVGCQKHGVRENEPCWWILDDHCNVRSAVCGQRTRKVFTGQPSAKSTSRNYTNSRKKENAA